MRRPFWILGCWVAITACGGRTTHAAGSSPATGGAGPDHAGVAGAPAEYTGRIWVHAAQYQSNSSCSVTASFSTDPLVVNPPCPDGSRSAGDCCCTPVKLSLPVPGPASPHAGSVTVTTDDDSTVLATLEPAPETDALPGRYPLVGCLPWSPGEWLRIAASGGEVDPFSVTIPTSSSVSSPLLEGEPEPLVVDTTKPLTVTWAPEIEAPTTVSVMLDNPGTYCTCTVPDAMAEVTIDAALLEFLAPTVPDTGTVRVMRQLPTRFHTGNVDLLLTSEVTVVVDVEFE